MNLVEELRKFSALFDYGCEIGVGEDGIAVEGWDHHPRDTKHDGSFILTRSYYADFNFNEDAGEYEDTLTPLLEKIKADNAFSSAARTGAPQVSP